MTSPESRWIGKPVRRREDDRLVRGAGSYVSDISLPGMLHMGVVRSTRAHARLRNVDVSGALALPGTHAAVTAKDMDDSVLPLPVMWRLPEQQPSDIPALAGAKVRYVGEPLAAVVAESRYLAEDALGLVTVDYEDLPVVVDAHAAMNASAPVVNDEWGGNVGASFVFEGGDVAAAFAEAAVVVTAEFRINRHSAIPMEGRGMVASWDAVAESLTVWSPSQSPHSLRRQLAECLRLPPQAVRVISPDIGGGFGVKFDTYPEDLLVCALSRQLGRPVKWVEDRSEHFHATVHAREQLQNWRLALTEDGIILGLEGEIVSDLGAHFHVAGMGPAWSTGSLMPNQYRLANYRAVVSAVATNKTPNSTYRGFGAPEAVFAIERLMDKAAKRLSLDPAEIRRRNVVRVDEQPYGTVTGGVYDSGDYGAALQRALEAIDYPAVRQEQAELRRAGVRRGIGIGSYVYISGFSPSYLFGLVGYERSGHEAVRVVIEPSGGVAVYTGMVAIGQGTETVLAQATADRLGIDMTAVRVISGDTAMTPYSDFGTVGSRINVAIVAAFRAVDDLKEKVIAVGAGLLEVPPTLCEFAEGAVRVRGESSRCVPLADVAREAYLAHHVPEGFEPGLDTIRAYDPPNHTWGFGCHIAVVDVEPDTGRVTWVRYVAVGDHGTLVNPLLADGQIQGGLAQGIGGALLEQLPYDEAGQLLVSSLTDYCMPTFNDLPPFEIHHLVTPSPHTEGGFKGVGEAGVIPAAAAIANAVSDALGIDMDRLPLTPNTVWNAARSHRNSGHRG